MSDVLFPATGERVVIRRKDDVRRLQTKLARVYDAEPRAKCLCVAGGTDLVVCLLSHEPPRKNFFYLRAAPQSAHSVACPYGTAVKGSGKGSRDAGAVLAIEGGWRIRADGVVDLEPTEEEQRERVSSGPSRQSARIRVLHLLRLLWTWADLNVDSSELRRTWADVYAELRKASRDQSIGFGAKLDDSLAVIPAMGESKYTPSMKRTIRECFENAAASRRRILLVAELGTPFPETSTNGWASVFLKGTRGWGTDWRGLIRDDERARVMRRFKRELGMFGKERARVIVATLAECNAARKSFTLSRVAIMTTTSRFIPVDSSYELAVINRLAAERRAYAKPLGVEGDENELPDVELLDASERAFVCEVFGFDGSSAAARRYLRRAADKVETYNERFGENGWWQWWPSRGEMPAFPPVLRDDA